VVGPDVPDASDAAVAVRAARAGAAVARARSRTELSVLHRLGTDFTTDADIEAERAVRAVLAQDRPGDAIRGEELGADGDSSRCWLVDPICGTLNFAAGLPLFAVNVALEVRGVTVAAAVVDVASGRVFWTDGIGAWQRADATDGFAGSNHPLAPTPASNLLTFNLESSYPGSIAAEFLFDSTLRTRLSPRCLSTTLALAWVASGQHAAYVTGGDLRSNVHWNAGIALCQTAGAVVTNLAGGDLHTGDHGLVAAADRDTHDFVVARLNAMREPPASRSARHN